MERTVELDFHETELLIEALFELQADMKSRVKSSTNIIHTAEWSNKFYRARSIRRRLEDLNSDATYTLKTEIVA